MQPTIARADFEAYERVRQSGLTNMANVRLVCKQTGLTHQQVIDIIEHYSTYAQTYK